MYTAILKTTMALALGLMLVIVCTACKRNTELQLLDEVAELVSEHHYDPGLHGLDWPQLQETYSNRVANSTSRDEAMRHINDMLQMLGDSHCGVGNANEALFASSPYVFASGSPGFDIRLVDGQVLVYRVAKGSSAELNHIRPGYVVTKIDDVSVEKTINEAIIRAPLNFSNKRYHQTKALLWRIYGTAGTSVDIEYIDADSQTQTATLSRVSRSGAHSLGEGLPPVYIEVEHHVLDGKVNYLRFNAFRPDYPSRIVSALERFDQQLPLIIDIRGNNGGSVAATLEIISRFTSEPFLAFKRISRTESEEFMVEPHRSMYAGKTVILVDEMSISAAENFARIMQTAGLATVIGVKTPGQLLWGEGFVLEDGSLAVIPVAQVVYPDGAVIEGLGVTPDITVSIDTQMRHDDIDTALRRAVDYLGGH